ncbi:MAG TPA: protease HtpX [Desulfotomaculum sp.]|nr:protease HtpX [Desulfotomaculum sp.]
MSKVRIWLLMAVLSIILVLIGRALFGGHGAVIFFLIALGMNFFTYYQSDKIAIAMTRSRPLGRDEAPEIYEIVEHLSMRAGLPTPRIYLTPSPQPNAFATGRNPQHAAVAVTDGLLRLLNRTEIEGVLAHELAHVKNRDTLVGTIAAALAGAVTMIASIFQWGLILGAGRDDEEGGGALGGLVLAILAPLAAMLVQMAISRAGEFNADATGARIAGRTDGLTSALEKLESAARRVPMQVNPAASHLFIVNPLSGESVMKLFSTHPPVAERVKRLRAMSF